MREREFDTPFPVDGPVATGRRTTATTAASRADATAADTTQAPTDMVYLRTHDLTEVPPSERVAIHEPSVVTRGSTVFFTANTYAARSADGGRTFTYVSPYSTFPVSDGGFCCDQMTHFAPAQNMFLWLLQYYRSGGANRLRLARAIGPSQVASNFWRYYDFTPQDFDFPPGTELDFPNLTVTTNYLYGTSNVGQAGAATVFGSVIWRIPLSQLAAGGTIEWEYVTFTDVRSTRCAEGSTTFLYCGSVRNTQSIRIFGWADNDSTIYWNDRTVLPFTWMNGSFSMLADGTNWAARADSRMLGAWFGGGVIGFMWMANADADFPRPYTILTRFNEGLFKLTDIAIWHNTLAWLYPTATVNARGHVAGLIFAGGGTTYPTGQIWTIDDVQGSVDPLVMYTASTSSAGPSANVWGDYSTVRPHADYPNTWVAAHYYMGAGGGHQNSVGRYTWFGRSRDLPSAPAITTHPAGRTIASGQTATMSVEASGTPPLSYQWLAGSTLTGFTVIAGATAATYTTPPLTMRTQYFARAISDYGIASSNIATIAIGVAPMITTQPVGGTVAPGQTAKLLVSAAGTGTSTYQWYRGARGDTSSPIPGATLAAVAAGPIAVPTYFWVRVSNQYGSVDSDAVLVRVSFTDPSLVRQVTPVQAAHIEELRVRVNNMRVLAGLQPVAWSNAPITRGVTIVTAPHILELRAAIDAVYTQRGLPLPSYFEPDLRVGSTIRIEHINDLRAALAILEPYLR